MRSIDLFLLLLFFLPLGCKHETVKESPRTVTANCDTLYGNLVADSITYDVIIRNPDPSDEWTSECLKNMHQRVLIDSIFDLVYSEKIKAFDFFTKVQLSPREIKKMESEDGYNRDRIGKIQFTEKWFFNKQSKAFKKEIFSLVLGYEIFNADSTLRGYKPVFKIWLNQ